ncbi:hypothetical protein HWV62_40342 [Athelia sp. TMB]|nr:hypothetical protein HWV62_40342 [Athelia sp. TMB]
MANYRALTSTLNLSNTNVVVLGGTTGIGAAIAVRFAALGASVLVMGRTEAAGADVVRAMQSASGDGTAATLSYGRADLGTVTGIRNAADDIAAWAGPKGVDYLIQSQGTLFRGPATGIWPPSTESVTCAFHTQVLSHFLVPYLLLSRAEPVLRDGARVFNVARPGEIGRTIDMDDVMGLQLMEGRARAFVGGLLKWAFIIDLFTEEFNRRFPRTRTLHAFPGSVATTNKTHPSLPWIYRAIGWLATWFAQAPADYADVAVWEAASEEWKTKDWTFCDYRGKEVKVDESVLVDDGLRVGVWDKLLEMGGEKRV